jgi:hypothetical protein
VIVSSFGRKDVRQAVEECMALVVIWEAIAGHAVEVWNRSGYCFTPASLNGRLSISLELLDSAQAGAGTAIYVALVNMS